MKRAIWIWIGIVFFGVGYLQLASPSRASQEPSSPPPSAVSPQRAILNRYCITCHNERLRTADLLLDKADVDKVSTSPEIWEKVVRKLRTRGMPPAGMPRPDNATYESLASYLETALDREAAAKPNPGRPADHRLNRAEYANAIRELLALDIDTAFLLPPDDSSYGFDNIGDTLSVSPLLMEKYMLAAGKISRLAIGDRNMRPGSEEYKVPELAMQEDRESEDLSFGSRGGIAIHHTFPVDGEYAIRIRLQRNNDGFIRGLVEPHQLDVRLDNVRIKLFTVGGEHKGKSGPLFTRNDPDYRGDIEQVEYEMSADDALEVRAPAQAGTREVGVAFLKQTSVPEGIYMPSMLMEDVRKYRGGDPEVASVTIIGPYNTKGLGDTPSRRKIFVCHPAGPNSASEAEPCARKILTNLGRLAYRRPLTDNDTQTLMNLYKKGSEGGFEAGIDLALQRILAGPEFLFRVDRDPANAAPGSVYRVSDLALASRLSFFLWSSIPDQQLLDLAERGKLKDREVLDQQVRRMLADSRSQALVDNFAGQWLDIRNMRAVSPDPKLFPDFDDELREAFQQETMLFFESMVREDRTVMDLLTADYTYVNERLARHYGIPNIYGSHFRRVTLTDEARRGLLGQGTILTVTSRANRTSPVLRGKWVMENLLGTPPPPPPPNVVAALDGKPVNGKILTVRQQMEQHRANPACSVCHARMDPIGFGLDNFDATGKWRTTEGGNALDVSGVLADGTKFNGPVELRKALLSRPEQLVTTVTEKLLTYALGRGVEYYDEPVVRQIMQEAAPGGYRWSSLIVGIVNSMPFQMRKAAEPATAAGLR